MSKLSQLFERPDRFAELSCLHQQERIILVCSRVVGLERQPLSIALRGFRGIALAPVEQTQVKQRTGVPRSEREGLLKVSNRRGRFVELGFSQTQIRPDGHGFISVLTIVPTGVNRNSWEILMRLAGEIGESLPGMTSVFRTLLCSLGGSQKGESAGKGQD